MNVKYVIAVFVCILLLCPVNLPASDVARIGIVDFQEILKRSLAGKQIAAKLHDLQKDRTSELKQIKSQIVSTQEKLDQIRLTDNVTRRKELQLELSGYHEMFRNAEKNYSLKMRTLNTESTARIKNELKAIVEQVGKNGGYLLIIEKEAVLYSPHANNITENIIELYDQSYRKKESS